MYIAFVCMCVCVLFFVAGFSFQFITTPSCIQMKVSEKKSTAHVLKNGKKLNFFTSTQNWREIKLLLGLLIGHSHGDKV